MAIALLVPIPLLAASGLSLDLPETVERGIASLLPFAEGGSQASPEGKPASGGAPRNIGTADRTRPVEAPTTALGGGDTTSQGATSSRGAEARSSGTRGNPDRPAPTGVGSDSVSPDGASIDGTSPDGGNTAVSAEFTPNSPPTQGAGEPGRAPESNDERKPPLPQGGDDGQGVSAEASLDEGGNIVVTASVGTASVESGVDAGGLPDGLPPVTAEPLPSSELPLP